MRTLVTGGAGFIGSHLVEQLLAEGHEVIIVDNFVTGHHGNLKLADPNGRTKLVTADIADYDAIEACFEGVDWVFHMAALADIVPSIEKPKLYFDCNVNGTVNVLEAARAAGSVKKIVYMASSSSYGHPPVTPTPETAPIQPTHPYALTKWLGEESLLKWGEIYNLPVISIRCFNVFGPRSRTAGAYGAVFGVFLRQKLAGHPYTVVGDGTQTRDFTFVTDVIDALVTAARSDKAGEVFNVGSGNTYSVNYLVELLGGEVVHIPKRPGEPDCTFADITKIRSMLDWEPKVSFEDGVKAILENIEMWRDAPLWTVDKIGDATRTWFKYLSEDRA